MKKILLLMLIVSVALLGVRCDDPYLDEEFTVYEDLPIGKWLVGQPEYSLWVELLKKADLLNGIDISSTKFTCFVADNDAVTSYLKENGFNSVAEIDSVRAQLLMRYHIIADASYRAIDFKGQLANKTLSQDYLTIKSETGGITNLYINQQAKIITTDIKRLNGYIHKLDNVLKPILETVWDLLQAPRYSIFRNAVEKTGMDAVLNLYEKQLGDIFIRDYKTVFAVSDSVYNVNGIYSVDDLINTLKTKYSSSDGEVLLKDYISYHIAKEFSDFRNLGSFSSYSEKKVRNVNTYNKTELISIADERSKLVFNRHGDERGVELLDGYYDILANNGYIHEVDKIMFVTVAEAAVVAWELTDYDVFRALDIYRKHSSLVDGNKYTIDRKAAESEGLRWSTGADTREEEAVRYYLRSAQGFNYNDAATMTLGYVGWAEFKSPVIARGKYEIIIKYLGYNARGTARFYFDNVYFTEHAFTSNYTKTIGTIEFPEQTDHIFKVTVVKKGDMEIDQLIFKPIN